MTQYTKEQKKEIYNRFYQKNKERLKQKYQDNEELRLKRLEYAKKYNKTEKGKEIRRRYENSPKRRILRACRKRLRKILKPNNIKKADHTLKLIGCSKDYLVEHLESRFTEGMSWDNYGKWHIDHIKPCCSFDLSDPEQQRACFHYTNLQPLWAEDNIKKGGNMV